MKAQKTQCFQGVEGTRTPAAKRPDEGFSLSQRRLRTRRSGVRIPYSVPRRRGLRIVRDGVFFFKANAVSHSLRRSSFQNQNRTGASCLVDNFGIPLCLVLILYWKAASLVERLAKNPASPFGPAGFLSNRDSNHVRKPRWGFHRPVQKLVDTFISFSPSPRRKRNARESLTACQRKPFNSL